LKNTFPARKFVSVNDHLDTIDGINSQEEETGSRIQIPITNAFNEQISLDIRNKTQSALNVKAANGMFTRAPFDYRKSDDNHFKLEVDTEAAETVKRIFSMAAKDTAINAIVRYLNDNSIPQRQFSMLAQRACREIMMMVTAHGILVLTNTF